uniref:Uncharacterized protein n=1 Tax=viral metagenome TaxID=1070528 RepID=A0A6C0KC84_9ZZZZ
MATVSSAGAGSSMGNMQAGTRGLSAGDWTRLQRLRGAKTYATVNLATNKDIAPTPTRQWPYGTSLLIPKDVGTGKIRRPASMWTDYRASQTADFVLQRANNGGGFVLTDTNLCDCSTTTVSVKRTGCSKCGVFTHKTIQ